MGKVSTQELLDMYYASVAGTSVEKTRVQIDRPELYAYEVQIGKELIDMDVDDLFGLIIEFRNKRKGKEIKYMISHSSYDQLSTLLRSIFNFYIDNVQPIRNPLNDKRMKGKEAAKRLAQGREPFRWTVVEDIIRKLHRDFDADKAYYIELIILLFYNGFAKAEDVVTLKADMINHHNKTVKLPERIVHLSDRCYELLIKFDKLDTIAGWRGDYILASWQGSYFKFIVRPSQEDKLNDRPKTAMCDIINRYIATNVNDKYDTKINYHILYMLGFYEFIVGKHGDEKTNAMITSYRDSDDVAELMSLAEEYGVQVDNISHLKRYLRPFIVADEE